MAKSAENMGPIQQDVFRAADLLSRAAANGTPNRIGHVVVNRYDGLTSHVGITGFGQQLTSANYARADASPRTPYVETNRVIIGRDGTILGRVILAHSPATGTFRIDNSVTGEKGHIGERRARREARRALRALGREAVGVLLPKTRLRLRAMRNKLRPARV